MTYVKYTDPTIVFRQNDHIWIHQNDPTQQADWAAYQAWLAAGNTPVDGTQPGGPPPLPSQQLAATHDQLLAAVEEALTLLSGKGVLNGLSTASQAVLTNRAALRAKVAHE